METWRIHRFRVGDRYRVLQEVRGQAADFIAGEIIEFRGTAYSRYDSSTAFRFLSVTSGELKCWLLDDDDPDASGDLFVPEPDGGQLRG
jgi:hypothetical protein